RRAINLVGGVLDPVGGGPGWMVGPRQPSAQPLMTQAIGWGGGWESPKLRSADIVYAMRTPGGQAPSPSSLAIAAAASCELTPNLLSSERMWTRTVASAMPSALAMALAGRPDMIPASTCSSLGVRSMEALRTRRWFASKDGASREPSTQS